MLGASQDAPRQPAELSLDETLYGYEDPVHKNLQAKQRKIVVSGAANLVAHPQAPILPLGHYPTVAIVGNCICCARTSRPVAPLVPNMCYVAAGPESEASADSLSVEIQLTNQLFLTLPQKSRPSDRLQFLKAEQRCMHRAKPLLHSRALRPVSKHAASCDRQPAPQPS